MTHSQVWDESLLRVEWSGSCLLRSWWESVLGAEEEDGCENSEAEGSVLHNPGREDIAEAGAGWGESLRGSGQCCSHSSMREGGALTGILLRSLAFLGPNTTLFS